MAAPNVITDAAMWVARYSATLAGHSPWVDPGEAISYIGFQWGKTTAYGGFSYWEQAIPGESYLHDITGLAQATTYHFRIVGAAGALRSYGADRTFTTTTVSPPPAATPFMGWIIEKLRYVAGWLHDIFLVVDDWIWPFFLAAPPFYWLSALFSGLALNFYHFSLWVDDVANRIVTILTFDNIYSYFKVYFDAALNAWTWVQNFATDISAIIDTWWQGTIATVTGWIDALRDWALFWINYLQGQIHSLNTRVSNIISQIPDISEFGAWFSDLIDSAFREREPFWAGWQDWRDKVTEFFSDPEEWLYKAADRIIERFW